MCDKLSGAAEIHADRRAFKGCHWRTLEHDAEKCEAFSDDVMPYLFDLEADSDFRPIDLKSSGSGRCFHGWNRFAIIH
ncbi:hypothetical protein FJ958_01225 [Mesorhizobium sp. B2-3-5]|nr:hypothetical protein FJ958_01225 [Mesorhizobium sp. B2-3-5]